MRYLTRPLGLAVLGWALMAGGAGTPALAESASVEHGRAVARDMFRMYASGGRVSPEDARKIDRPRRKGSSKKSGNYYNRGRSINSGNFSNVVRSRNSNNSYNSSNNANGPQRIIIRKR